MRIKNAAALLLTLHAAGGPTVKAVLGTNLSHLAQPKKKYDPNNNFYLNQNLLPG
jgi:hypothetical protein